MKWSGKVPAELWAVVKERHFNTQLWKINRNLLVLNLSFGFCYFVDSTLDCLLWKTVKYVCIVSNARC